MSVENPAKKKNQVSIICRTLGRPELQQALRSIASQDYPNIEIVLVDATGKQSIDSAASGDRPLEFVSTGSALSRSAAANAGLEAAHGKYIQFLDDDDWIDPSHVSQLVNALESSDETAAAYSSTQKTNAAGDSLDYVFREAFDPILLMRDNYIPIHSLLFDSALLEHGCRFDETFDIYEDWDFWLQLSQHTNFQHIDSITAYYREGGDSDTALADVRLRYQADTALGKGRAAIFEKWLPKWTGERVNFLIGQLDQSVLLCEQDARIHSELRENAELQHEIEKRDCQINELDLKFQETASQLERLQDYSKQQAQQAQVQAQQAQMQAQHVSELEQRLNAIYGSLSWKLMSPVRRVSRILRAETESDNNESDSDK